MHVVLAIEELNGIHGGVERTVVNLANSLIKKSHRVTILTFENATSGQPVYALNQFVERVYLGLINNQILEQVRQNHEKWKSRMPRWLVEAVRNVKALMRVVTVMRRDIPIITKAFDDIDPDVVVSFKTHFHRYIIPAAVREGIPVVVSDHNPPDVLYYYYICAVDRMITFYYLKKARAIRILMDAFRQDYPKPLHQRCVAIGNGIKRPESPADISDAKQPLRIIHVGRLYFQKDQKTLIEAFALLADRYPDWGLDIYGDGPDYRPLKKLIEKYGLQNKAVLRGAVSDVGQAYNKGHIFALPSIFEGFGNVTLEALAHGLPVIAFDDVVANKTLIQTRENGMLVSTDNRVLDFAKGLEALMCDEDFRMKLGQAAYQSAQQYELGAVMMEWERLLKRAIKQ